MQPEVLMEGHFITFAATASTDDVSNDHTELLDCRAIADAAADRGDDVDAATTNGSSLSSSQLETVRFYVAAVLIPSLCVLGIVGNLFSVIVFTRRRMKVGLKFHIEQAGYEGLIALAVSDSLCCLSGLVASTAVGGSIRVVYGADEVWLLYTRRYVPCAQNAFVRTSTWLTVLTAVGRYAAICRPMHARRLIGVRETRVSVVVIFLLSAALELPSFWTFDVMVFDCVDVDVGVGASGGGGNGSVPSPSSNARRDSRLLLLDHGPFESNVPLRTAFSAVWTTFGFVFPACALSFCNVHLVRSLRESARLRRLVCRVASPRGGGECSRCRRYRGTVRHRDGRRGSAPDRLTPTLIAVVGAFLTLVAPSELVHYIGRHSTDLVHHNAEPYAVVLAVANLLQTVDFAFNFLLYCVVNVQFRDTCRHLVLGVLCRRRWRRRGGDGFGLSMPSAIRRRRLLLELGAGFAAVGAPTPAVGGICKCSALRRTPAESGTRDLSLKQRQRGGARLSLTVTGYGTVTGRRRSSAATVTAVTACTVGGWDRRKLSSSAVVETAL